MLRESETMKRSRSASRAPQAEEDTYNQNGKCQWKYSESCQGDSVEGATAAVASDRPEERDGRKCRLFGGGAGRLKMRHSLTVGSPFRVRSAR